MGTGPPPVEEEGAPPEEEAPAEVAAAGVVVCAARAATLAQLGAVGVGGAHSLVQRGVGAFPPLLGCCAVLGAVALAGRRSGGGRARSVARVSPFSKQG